MMIRFKKMDDFEYFRKLGDGVIVKWNDEEKIIDETKISSGDLQKFRDFMAREKFEEQ